MTPVANWLLNPALAFLVLLALVLVLAWVLTWFRFKAAAPSAGQRKMYACGEDVPDPVLQPDYRQFFPFAFFFTIMHVVALILATVPSKPAPFIIIAGLYLLTAACGLRVLYRRQD